MNISDATHPKFAVFKTAENTLVVICILDGEISVYGNTIAPVELKSVGTFEADGIGDYNWGIVEMVLKEKIPSLLKKARDIDRNGL